MSWPWLPTEDRNLIASALTGHLPDEVVANGPMPYHKHELHCTVSLIYPNQQNAAKQSKHDPAVWIRHVKKTMGSNLLARSARKMLVRACNLALHAKAAKVRPVPSFGRTQIDEFAWTRISSPEQVPPAALRSTKVRLCDFEHACNYTVVSATLASDLSDVTSLGPWNMPPCSAQ